MKISENAQRISGLLRGLTDDIGKVRTSFDRAANQVRLASNNMDAAGRDLDQMGRKIDSIQHESNPDELPKGTVGSIPSKTDGSLWES